MRRSAGEVKMAAAEKISSARRAFMSWHNFVEWIQVHDTALDQHGHKKTGPTWSNEDLDPTPPEKRTWRWWNYVVFYWGYLHLAGCLKPLLS